jgi:hypothetical protein
MSGKLLAAAAVLALAGAPAAQAANLIVNGSFEGGSGGQQLSNGSTALSPWVIDGPSGEIYWQPNGTNGTNSQDGIYNLDLTGVCDTRCSGGPYGGLSQTIATTVGATYHLSFYGGNWAPQGAPSGIQASAAGTSQNFVIPQTALASEWTLFGLDFTAAGGSTTVSFVGTAGTTFVGLDNVVVTAAQVAPPGVPEPAAWAMMLIGFAGLGGLLRRRRAVPA